MPGYLSDLLLCGTLASFGLLAQTSHRQPDPKPPREPNVFDQMEKQNKESPKEQSGRQVAAQQQHSANLAELKRELPQLIELAQKLENRLNATDLETALPADLEPQAKELEQVARQVRKHIRNL